MVKSGVSPDAMPVGYHPAMVIGSTCVGPNAPMSWRVTGPGPAFTKAWAPTSSPRRGVVGMALVVGSGEPTEIGIQCASMTHCSDGSAEWASAPRCAWASIPLAPIAVRMAREGPTVELLKVTVTLAEPPGARFSGRLGAEVTWKELA